jgi:hypothetical protein
LSLPVWCSQPWSSLLDVSPCDAPDVLTSEELHSLLGGLVVFGLAEVVSGRRRLRLLESGEHRRVPWWSGLSGVTGAREHPETQVNRGRLILDTTAVLMLGLPVLLALVGLG